MTTPLAVENASGGNLPAKRPRNRLRGCAMILGGFIVVGILTLGGIWLYLSHRGNEELAIQVAKVRARGEPLTTVELNGYYQPAKNRPDMTQSIVAALAICDAPETKEAAAELPLVGVGPEIPAPPNAWPQLEAVEDFLAQKTAALDAFREVTRREGTARYPVDFSPGVGAPLPQAQALRPAARVLMLQFHVHLHRGRTREAVESILDQLALARTIEQEPVLISQLVHLALFLMAVQSIHDLVGATHVDDADLLRLQAALRTLEFQKCLIRALAGERTFGYFACIVPQRMGEDAAPITPVEAREIAQRPPKRVSDAAKLLEFSLRIADAADQSLFAAIQESERVHAEMVGLAQGTLSKFQYVVTVFISPAYHVAIPGIARSAIRRDAVDAAIAAERYRRKNGAWPEKLEQLVPEYLPAVPIDPFNNQPLKIISTIAEFKVYSVGKDRKDDGGTLSDVERPDTDTGFAIPAGSGE